MTITKDIRYIGVNDHAVDLFEGQYVVPGGMCYNSYAIVDEKVAIMDRAEETGCKGGYPPLRSPPKPPWQAPCQR